MPTTRSQSLAAGGSKQRAAEVTPAKRPSAIGLTLDNEPPGGYSKLPWYALRENYFDRIAELGGLPFALPHEPELVPDYLSSWTDFSSLAARSMSTRPSTVRWSGTAKSA